MSDRVDLRALFLGPKGGNKELLVELVTEAILDQAHWRRNFHPDDAPIISERTKGEKAFQRTRAAMRDEVARMLAELRGSVPFFSPRYIAHMNADVLLPAVVGYIAAMLYNPNNVTSESSPVTSRHEVEVGEDLAGLLGFPTQTTFGHLTSGGTTANYEALWIARDLRYLPLLCRDLVAELDVKAVIRLVTGESVEVGQADDWQLLNVEASEAIECYFAVLKQCEESGVGLDEVRDAAKASRNAVGEAGMYGQVPGRVIVPATAHYSWLKAVELLGMGRQTVRLVPVDSSFRLSIPELNEELQTAEREKQPVVAIVGVFGSTEEGSIDPIDGILNVRRKWRKRGVDAFVHTDAAYGGYARALFREPTGQERSEGRILRDCDWPSGEVYRAQRALGGVDAVTIDPHKLGYVPYSCGAIVFRDRRWRELIRAEAPYIIHTLDGGEDTGFIGQYVLEGSKAGAAAAAVCLAHRVLGLDSNGYGALIGASIRGIQQLYQRFVGEKEWSFEADIRVGVYPLVRPDLNILCFVVNRTGNESLAKMNDLNDALYRQLSYGRERALGAHRFFISKTAFRWRVYGEAGEAVLVRAGVDAEEYRSGRADIVVLRMTLMHPWYEAQMEPDLIEAFGREVRSCVQSLVALERGLFY